MRSHLFLLLATLAAAPVAAQSPRTPPDFGPNVTIFDPATPAATIEVIDRDMIAVPVSGNLRLVVVGAPAYFARRSPPYSDGRGRR
jgi:hypothetical protein